MTDHCTWRQLMVGLIRGLDSNPAQRQRTNDRNATISWSVKQSSTVTSQLCFAFQPSITHARNQIIMPQTNFTWRHLDSSLTPPTRLIIQRSSVSRGPFTRTNCTHHIESPTYRRLPVQNSTDSNPASFFSVLQPGWQFTTFWTKTAACQRVKEQKLECGPMPKVMAALPNIGGALCSMP